MLQQMNNKIRVLQINASSKYGGVSTMILNYCRQLYNEVFFDFLSPEQSSFNAYKEEINNTLKGNVYELNISFKGMFKYHKLYKAYNKFLNEHSYNVIHINSGVVLYNYVIAKVSKKHNIKKIIIHSHNAIKHSKVKDIIINIFRNRMDRYATDYIACSTEAALSMFPDKIIEKKNYIILNNAIQLDKFMFDNELREVMRKKYNITDEKVVGQIARFVPAKNHQFVLKIMQELIKINSNYKLVLVGSGELLYEIKQLSRDLKISNNIIFVGEVKDTTPFYQLFDLFLLPSLYEGLPVVSIEAQTAGLPCFLSDAISKECNITNNIHFLSLDSDASEWAIKINQCLNEYKRKSEPNKIVSAGFDIKEESKKLKEIYTK